MKKLKISLLLLLVFTMVIHTNFIYATEPVEEETVVEDEATIEDTSDDTSSQGVVQEDVIDGSLSSFAPSTVTSVSTLDNYSKANLHLSNILSIILISIGVVLIIFAGAILIRLKG